MWARWQLIAFRFALIAAALTLSLHVFIFVPSRTLADALFTGWHQIATWLGALLGLDVPPLEHTGSGDQLFHYLRFLAVLIIATIATAIWTWRSTARAYPRLADAATSALRFMLAGIMIGYGMAKLVPMQFPPLWLGRYDQSLGEMSPMGLLWTFMGQSPAYSVFAGAAEVVGSLLLLWRRTYVAGALILIGVMTNVVVLNLCYDVPVKLFSMQLLVLLVVVIAPQLRRLCAAALGYPAREMPPRVRGTLAGERVRLAIKLAAIAMIALFAYRHWEFGERIREWREPTPLQGSWVAERVVIDGVEHPPLFTDDVRWRKLIFHEIGLTIRYATDRRVFTRAEVDVQSHTILVTKGILRQVWRYQRPDDEHLIVDTPHVHAELVLEPEPLLKTRGFHWVQEAPFGR